MELYEMLLVIAQEAMKGASLTDYATGTVTSASPLEITTDATMQVLKSPVLILTAAVVEKKIPVLAHKHYIKTLSHTHVIPTGTSGPALVGEYLSEDSLTSQGGSPPLQNESIICYENGEALPVENGYIILNRALEEGDKVIMLRVNGGQRFIVLSRVFSVEGSD